MRAPPGRDAAGSVVQSLCTVAVVSLGSSVSDFFTAPVTHQDQGRSRNRSSDSHKPAVCGAERPLTQSRSGANLALLTIDPFRHVRADQKIFGTMPCPRGMSQTLWFLTNPGMAHGMGSEDTLNLCGWNGFQSELVVLPTPFQVHRSSQPLCKELLGIKRHAISHDEVGSPGQLMGEGAVGDHEVGSCCFPLVIGSGI